MRKKTSFRHVKLENLLQFLSTSHGITKISFIFQWIINDFLAGEVNDEEFIIQVPHHGQLLSPLKVPHPFP